MAAFRTTTLLGVPATGLPAATPSIERAGNSRAMRAVRDDQRFHAWLDRQADDRRRLRGRMETAVERLLAVLDAIDGDPDLEPDQDMDRADEEPSLGWTGYVDQSAPNRCDSSDRELTEVSTPTSCDERRKHRRKPSRSAPALAGFGGVA